MMSKICKAYFVTILCLLVTNPTFAQGVEFLSDPKFKDLIEIAKKENKKIFIDCYTVWCGPCKRLTSAIFPQAEMGAYFNKHFVNVKLDMEKPEGIAFKKRYPESVNCYPTLIFIDPHTEKIIHKFTGAREVNEMIAEAKVAVTGNGLTEQHKEYEAGNRDFDFIKGYVGLLRNANEDKKMYAVIDDYLKGSGGFKQLYEEDKWNFFKDYLGSSNTEMYDYVVMNFNNFAWKNFIDRDQLLQTLGRQLLYGVNGLVKISQIKGKKDKPTFEADQALYEKYMVYAEKLKNYPNILDITSKLYLYNQLLTSNWNEAYESISFMKKFKTRLGETTQKFPYYILIAEHINDQDLKSKMLAEAKQAQIDGEKFMQGFNIYHYMANLADHAGDKTLAKEYWKDYDRLVKEREKKFGKMTVKKTKK